MEINDKNPQIIFNMAMIYKTKGDEETADQLFGQVIMNFAGSPLAESARAERGTLAGDRRMPGEKDLTEEKLQGLFLCHRKGDIVWNHHLFMRPRAGPPGDPSGPGSWTTAAGTRNMRRICSWQKIIFQGSCLILQGRSSWTAPVSASC